MTILRNDLLAANNLTAELKRDLNVSRSDAQTLAAKTVELSSEVERKKQDLEAERLSLEFEKSKNESAEASLAQEIARLPPVPVRIEIRKSVVGRGLVAMFTNTSAMHLSLVMGTRNPTTQVVNQFSF